MEKASDECPTLPPCSSTEGMPKASDRLDVRLRRKQVPLNFVNKYRTSEINDTFTYL
jgi:hypothetical protein